MSLISLGWQDSPWGIPAVSPGSPAKWSVAPSKAPRGKRGCRAALTDTAEGVLVRVSQALCDKEHGRLFALAAQVACSDLQNCPNTASLHSNNFQSLTTVHCRSISRYFTSSLYSTMKTSLSPQVTCLIYLDCTYIGREQPPMLEQPRLHCCCFNPFKKRENLLKHQPHIYILYKNSFPVLFHSFPQVDWNGKVSDRDTSPLNKTWQVPHHSFHTAQCCMTLTASSHTIDKRKIIPSVSSDLPR